MTTYVWRNGRFVDKKTGEAMTYRDANAICAPQILRDIPEYRSPIDGRLISSRSTQREDLKKNDCVLLPPPEKKREFKNPRFTKKHNLPLAPSVRDTLKI